MHHQEGWKASSDILKPSDSSEEEGDAMECVDVSHQLYHEERLVHGMLRTDNGWFLREMRRRIDRVGINIPKIEVRFERLCVEADAHIGRRALPTLVNATINTLEDMLGFIGLSPSNKAKLNILKRVNGIVKPSRMTLVLGPPSSGKTTLLQALAGKLDPNLRVRGKVTYNGKDLRDFEPLRTCSYVGQHDLHNGRMTVRETLDFSCRLLGNETQSEMLAEICRREKALGITPHPEIDTFMKANLEEDKGRSLVIDHILKVLGLENCADTIVGDQMQRGISGGQKKRLTIGEMLVGSARVFFMDEISTGLDSLTIFQIVEYLHQFVHTMDVTMVISMIQPTPETFQLFDEVILMNEGQIAYQGPREKILDFFKFMGFSCPSRKNIADFLQEVMSKMDQEQYWADMTRPYKYVPIKTFARAFQSFHVGQLLNQELHIPCDLSKACPFALASEKYGLSRWQLFVACFWREWLLMKRNSFLHIFKMVQISIMALIVMTVFLRTGTKQGSITDGNRFLRQFLVLFCMHQMSMGLFRLIAAVGRTAVVANSFAIAILIAINILGGFIISKDDIPSWWVWGYWVSPMTYSQNGVALNEFLDKRWSLPNIDVASNAGTVGKAFLKSRGMFSEEYWFWICIGAVAGFSLLFNVLCILALGYLSAPRKHQACGPVQSDKNEEHPFYSMGADHPVTTLAVPERGMVLPFQPFSLAFNHISYYINMPAEMKEVVSEKRLRLLKDVSGAFRPQILTAVMGVSGAGKTTLMDVLAGRKTGGYIEGNVSVSGYPKNQETFARISGYCEQIDIHSPFVTVYESLLFSAWLRLPRHIEPSTRKMFVEEVMDLVELKALRNSLVGVPGLSGLSTEQRKRLTIAVELVANPSIIFMDEPTSGLDARAAAIVMRVVRNTVDTGRTVVCTIHQPSIDIFEAFDELLLMKKGGQLIYEGPLGHFSQNLIQYFEAIPGIPKIKDGYNPAAWMLDITSSAMETDLAVDFAQVYCNSCLYKENQQLIEELSRPSTVSKDLSFESLPSQNFLTQCMVCLWKQHWSYWRNPQYNAIRFLITITISVLFATIFWGIALDLSKQQDFFNALGAIYSLAFFLGFTNTTAVQPIVGLERMVLYREKSAGMYSAMPYAIAQVVIEIPYIVIQVLLFVLIVYPMIGFSWMGAKFLWFTLFMLLSIIYFTLFGMMTVALTPTQELAGILSFLVFILWNIFSGFYIARPMIPLWWRWFYWVNPAAWTIYGLMVSQLGDCTETINLPGQASKSVKDVLEDYFGIEAYFLSTAVAVHIVFIFLFLFVFCLCTKYLNFQRR
ncbi:ABC transporter G family member 39 isoform X2 [Amborella trichopoda]|uniref:ABC transporter G family member 39 isoform X2 n=1 Tax=Amborella trichopoda TaxID=13333 RepID=UPI0009BF6D04|nr:ABC transporter G family member 39 isoform X2 [Amborella trichopoda]|eukprot:XP_020531339.1 ABC transporter G family member 39 isoform X2 [Amborella trichopoda]